MTSSPVLDEQVLGRLREEVGDQGAVCGFLGRYADLLDQRVDRLGSALVAHDLDDWHDAALSLKTSSAMAGATALSELVGTLLDDVTESDAPVVWWYCRDRQVQLLDGLRTLAAQTAERVHRFLEESDNESDDPDQPSRRGDPAQR